MPRKKKLYRQWTIYYGIRHFDEIDKKIEDGWDVQYCYAHPSGQGFNIMVTKDTLQ